MNHSAPTTPRRRALGLAAAVLGAAVLLGGCASWNAARGDVSSYGSWPAGRAPGSYAFDRLPSQDPADAQQQAIERAAAAALQAAGFQPAAEGQAASVKVQIGARIAQELPSPWNDPFWVRGGLWRGPWGPGWGPGYGWGWRYAWANPEYGREAALLIRDAASGQALYEGRSRNSGPSPGGDEALDDLFRLTLADFPQARPEPHAVSLPALPRP